ncbi:TIGR01906 family membrane protein [Xylocopilactobacillus apis]|uniref:TIGR01906 family membrane protein n=1 Tax=Xylocopilactobacillus apis TaxID=2932183 RepID=UPI003CE4D82F
MIIFLFALTSSILLALLISPFVFNLIIKPFNLINISGLSQKILQKNYLVLLNYLLNPFIKNLYFPNFVQSSNGLEHFIEVKNLFIVNNIVFFISLVTSAFVFKNAYSKKRWLTLKKSVRFFSFLPVIFVFIFLITNFDQFFIEFHHILFRNSNWIFDPAKDPIINVLPEEFFQIEFIIFFVLLMLILFLINLLISRQIKKELLLNNSMNIPVASK